MQRFRCRCNSFQFINICCQRSEKSYQPRHCGCRINEFVVKLKLENHRYDFIPKCWLLDCRDNCSYLIASDYAKKKMLHNWVKDYRLAMTSHRPLVGSKTYSFQSDFECTWEEKKFFCSFLSLNEEDCVKAKNVDNRKLFYRLNEIPSKNLI